MITLRRLALAAVVVCLAPLAASAQAPPADSQQLQPTRRAPITLTPSLTVSQEFNDNILLDNNNKRSDMITGFTPGLEFALESPTYRLAARYNFTGEVYWRDSDRNQAFDRQNFSLDSFYRVNPRLTLNLTDSLVLDTNTNVIAPDNVATGRDRSVANTLTPSLSFQLDPQTTLRGLASHALQRFEREDLSDSDIYRAEAAVERTLTPRFSGVLGYRFGYFDIENEDKATAHTPFLGLIYRITERLTASVSGGPTIVVTEDETHVLPGATAAVNYRVFFGSVGAQYDQYIGTAGGLGRVTNNQSVSTNAQIITLMRGLVVDLGARYAMVDSIQDNSIDIQGLTLSARATYRINAWLSLVGSYTFFHQNADTSLRTNQGTPIANDIDQNRVYVGLTFAYPVKFD